MEALAELERRKTEGMKYRAQFVLSLNTIIAPTPQQQYHPYKVANVAESATFAGVLKHRGAIMRLLRSFTPMSQWTVQTVLAYFISNLNECMSFTQHHQQTRVRLLANLAARLNNKDAPLMAAYTLACMEHAYHISSIKPDAPHPPTALASLGKHFDPNDPTKHQIAFAYLFQANIEDFVVLHGIRNLNVGEKVIKYLDRVQDGPLWANVSTDTQALFDWCLSEGAKQLKDMLEKTKKKSRGKRKKRTQPDESDEDVPLASFNPVLPKTVIYDDARIREHNEGNLLLQGLVEPMPYVRTLNGDEEEETMGLGKTMELATPDKDYEQGLDDMFHRDNNTAIDGADIVSLVSKRDT